ncbi:MAG: PAS domain S-box protein [Dehalococcoidia bacterium]
MKDAEKIKSQLIDELVQMRQRIAELEASEAERKKAEEALRESENRYKAMFDNRLQMIYINDGKGLFIDANDYALERLGYTGDDIRKVSFQDIIHPDDLPAVLQVFSEILTKGSMERSIEIRLVTKSGEIIWVETFGIPLDHGVDDYIALGIAYDITERKRAEEAVRESEEKLRFMFESIEDAIMATDLQGNIVDFNEAALRKHGYTHKEEITGRNAFELISPKDRARLMEDQGKVIEGDSSRSRKEYTLLTSDGSDYEAEFSYGVMRDSSGNPAGLIGVMRDITERKRAEEALRESEERYRLLAVSIRDVIWTTDMHLHFTYVSPSVTNILGYSIEELIGQSVDVVLTSTSLEVVTKLTEGESAIQNEAVENPRKEMTLELELDCREGSTIWTETKMTLLRDPDGQPVGVLGVTRDITERKKTEEALKESEELSRGILDTATVGIYLVQDKVLQYVSPEFEQITGYTRDELIGTHSLELVHPEDRERVREKAIEHLKGQSNVPYEYRFKCKDGGVLWILERVSSIAYKGKQATVASFMDITERKKTEETIRHLAYHDTLTDLPNRPLFNEILTLELARAQRNQQQVAVMLLDLDEFKHVNDTLGHPVGDQLLKAVADRMRRSVRKGDTVARMGGDEFMLVLPEMSQAEDAARIAQKLMAAFTKPFVFRAHKLHITSSIGVAVYPHDGENSETLIKNADIAMYRAKEQGRNNYQYYTTAMNGRVLVDS